MDPLAAVHRPARRRGQRRAPGRHPARGFLAARGHHRARPTSTGPCWNATSPTCTPALGPGSRQHARRPAERRSSHAVRRHGWDAALPPTAVFFPEDYPAAPSCLPRALAEHVMAQVEHPANLDRWDNPACRLVTVILIRCGLRVSDACTLPVRLRRHRRRRRPLPALPQPQDETRGARPDRRGTRARMIRDQQQRVLRPLARRHARAVPRPQDERRTAATRSASSTYRDALYRWLARLRRPRRARPARAPDPPPVAAHARHRPDQPRRPPARRAEDPRSRLTRDDRALRPAVGQDRPASTGRKPARSTPKASPSRSAPTARSATPPGPNSSCPGPPRRCRTATASCPWSRPARMQTLA